MSRQFEHLPDVEAFLAVVHGGSMTAGAVALATTPSVLSRAITRLEAHLGVQLLRRTTRRLSLTDAGRRYHEQAQAAFSLIADTERALHGRDGAEPQLSGRIRLSVPTTYGHHRLAPLLARFSTLHTQVEVELSINNRNVDLIAEGFDLAIRLGRLRDSGLTVRRLEDAPLKLVASPDYLQRRGTPQALADLAGHALLSFVMPSPGRAAPWLLQLDGAVDEWVPQGAVKVLDDVLGCVSLAEHGAGICQSYDFVVAERIAQGRLVEVLPALGGATRPFSMLFAAHRHLQAPTRALIDFLAANVGTSQGATR